VQVVEIDGTQFGTLEEFFAHFAERACAGGWGTNLDAFNDVLRGGFGTPDGGFVLRWKNHTLSRERLGYQETVRQLERRLASCHPSNRPQVARELADARGKNGSTVFEWLLAIIREHGPGGSEVEDGILLELQ
jgi:RNAse (barnase) inhibitor barstar